MVCQSRSFSFSLVGVWEGKGQWDCAATTNGFVFIDRKWLQKSAGGDFSVKRIFLEQFKQSYILNTGSEDLSALIGKVDFSNQQVSDRYDFALLKLFNENDKNIVLLSKSLRVLPITAKRLALKRLSSKEFETFKRVKITEKRVRNKQSLLSTDARDPAWYWVCGLIFTVLATLTVAYIQ